MKKRCVFFSCTNFCEKNSYFCEDCKKYEVFSNMNVTVAPRLTYLEEYTKTFLHIDDVFPCDTNPEVNEDSNET